MQSTDNNIHAFLALVKAGLWEKDVQLAPYGEVNYKVIYRLALEQSVVGLVAAGLEHVVDSNIPKEDVLQFIGTALQLEQRNSSMNVFIGTLVEKMRKADIYTVLVKGQGIAQCYERPLWRSCGDVDLLSSDDSFVKTKHVLSKIATSVGKENPHTKHLDMIIEGWTVELHGSLHSQLSGRVDRVIDDTQQDVFYGGSVRSWTNGKVTVFLPSPDNDVIIVFTHILQHLFKGGIGLRQICDWCRLLWKYRDSLNKELIESRIKKAGVTTEWKVLASIAVDSLGLPIDAMPMYDSRFKDKGVKILEFIIEVGNFGHNRQLCYTMEQSAFVRKFNITKMQLKDNLRLASIFPLDSLRFFSSFFLFGIKKAVVKN